MTLVTGERVGEFRVTGALPCGHYRAVHPSGARAVLDVRTPDDWRLVAVQMVRAAASLESIDHPGVARILSYGVLPDHRPWVASELVDGIAVSDLMLQRKLAAGEVLAIVRDVADVLAYVHVRNVVHGNLRPQHIVMTTAAHPFRICVGGWAHLRAPGIPTFGDPPTPNVYVAPEHLVGAIDGRADVYTLGAIAYRALTGVFPDVASDLVGGEPGTLGDLIVHMLDPDPRQRPTAAEVHAILSVLTPDRVTTTPRMPRPRWTPQPGALDAYIPASGARHTIRKTR